ncbi:hypothetical protein GYMLUDRAFT_98254 [Collybiopsis luxurians FD-317 M1]|uniref:Uncharacterized protein n=1 Tax=Collybiopsis luxurians FD-317 M1 TaxID=944289 RepID=A0A0D0BRY6_9AGAR|nr:hypothetical protein GYMLUDRAFT_98254 [Collybiopsis luxurians FD-317 M1]
MAPHRLPRRNNRPRPYFIQGNSTNKDTTSRTSLFAGSRNVKIYGGVFNTGLRPRERHRSEAEADSHGIPKIPRHLVRSQDNLRRRDEWIFSFGQAEYCEHKGEQNNVIIQTFMGCRARQIWQSTIDYAQRLINPNLLNIVGTSSEESGAHYILFDAAQQKSTNCLIASGLTQGDRETTMFGTQIVYGIAV